MLLALIVLILLHDPHGNQIAVNPALVTTVRPARADEEGKLTAKGVRCILTMADGKFVSVAEDCEAVRRLMMKTEN